MSKQLKAFFSTDDKFFIYILVLIGIYIAQTFFKVSKCRKDGSFSWRELITGMIDYALYFVGIVVFFFAGELIPNENVITFDGKQYTITNMLTMIMWALIVIQAGKCFNNIRETFNVSDDDLVRSVDTINDYDVDKYYNG